MVLFATEADMPEVYRNWEVSFLDTSKEIGRFFQALSGKVRVIVKKEEGHVAAQLCLLPAKLYLEEHNRERELEAAYIYAVATAKEYRNRGLCTGLLEEVTELLKKENKCGILVPANATLAAFYEKRGFKLCFQEEKIVLKAKEQKTPLFLKTSDITTYITHRKANFTGTCRVEGCTELVKLAVEDFLKHGGSCAELTYEGKRYGILYENTEELKIKEITAGDSLEACRLGEAFLQVMGKKEGTLQRCVQTYGIGVPKALCEKGYFNLVLD